MSVGLTRRRVAGATGAPGQLVAIILSIILAIDYGLYIVGT